MTKPDRQNRVSNLESEGGRMRWSRTLGREYSDSAPPLPDHLIGHAGELLQRGLGIVRFVTLQLFLESHHLVGSEIGFVSL